MKALAIGDYFIPTKYMLKTFDKIKKNLSEVTTAEYKTKNRTDFRNKIRNVEHYGPEAEPTPEHLENLIKDIDILAIHQCPVPKKILDMANNLKVIISARGGVENIDMQTANKKNILVISTPNHNSEATAEYAIGLMLAETRNIARSYHALKLGEWREHYPNTEYIPELNSMKIGLLGFGNVARLVAQKLHSFRSKILVHDPFVPIEIIKMNNCISVDFDTLFKESDIISVHVRASRQTERLVGEKEFKMMKKSSYFINTGRASIIDMSSLYKALKEHWISGAAIDVYITEPVPQDEPLLTLDNVTFTNHRAGDTLDSYIKAPEIMANELLKLFKGNEPYYIANPLVYKSFNL